MIGDSRDDYVGKRGVVRIDQKGVLGEIIVSAHFEKDGNGHDAGVMDRSSGMGQYFRSGAGAV